MQSVPDPSKPHKFEPRQHGSRLACKHCGAAKDAAIHHPMKRGLIGQALVEMALITPLLLLLVLGIIGAGWWMLDMNQLNHAAQEAAVAGAMNPGDSCGVAIVTANAIYPHSLSSAECDVQGQYITVTITHPLPLHRIAPIWGEEMILTATATAVLR